MEVKIISAAGDSVEQNPSIPDKFRSFIIPSSLSGCILGNHYSMLFQCIKGEGFEIWYSNYLIQRPAKFQGMSEEPVLELHFNLSMAMNYRMEGLGQINLDRGYFNLTYAPFINNITNFEREGTYTSFDIHYHLDYLKRFAREYPSLSEFINNVIKEKPGSLSPYHGIASPGMLEDIHSIIHCKYVGETRKFFIDSMVMNLLIRAVDRLVHIHPTSGMLLRKYDLECLENARDLLIQQMENPPRIIELAHQAGINDFKLKKGFKMLYGTTIFEYLMNARMQKAEELLLDDGLPVAEIGYRLGFKSISNFIKIFKKVHGYTPGHFRKLPK